MGSHLSSGLALGADLLLLDISVLFFALPSFQGVAWSPSENSALGLVNPGLFKGETSVQGLHFNVPVNEVEAKRG